MSASAKALAGVAVPLPEKAPRPQVGVLKVLVVIANYGTKNRKYLEKLLAEYRRMPFQVDIVVLSDQPKQLGLNVEVRVGLPAANPWSLPFAYKPVLAERSQNYDLFIYSEDDVLITERNILAFLSATDILPDDCLAGFMRFEVSPEGTRYYSTMHGAFHWEPRSVMRLGQYVFARFTNEHSGCFMLTKRQLVKALVSEGFWLGFRKGRYGYPETAATDPYTQCRFRKVIAISHLQDFCLPHLPNVYLGKLGLEQTLAEREIAKLKSLDKASENVGPLFQPEAGVGNGAWDKRYYGAPREDLLAAVPLTATSVLSIGCGWGKTEARLVARGVSVAGIPLDCVVAVTAAAQGLEVLPPELSVARRRLEGRKFDCIMFADSLHRFPDPVAVLKQFLPLLEPSGSVLVSAPNFHYVGVLRDRLLGRVKLPHPASGQAFASCGLHVTTTSRLERWLRQSGLTCLELHSAVSERFRRFDFLSFDALRPLVAEDVVLAATR